MLRERRRHANFKPNRKLDPKSSRSTIYENEELRLRTININAEVERGQSDIKKLRKENDQLRREIWALRDEYDRLDKLLQASRNGRSILHQLNNLQLDSDSNGPRCDSCNQSEESNSSSCDTCDEDNDNNDPSHPTPEILPNAQKTKEKLHVNFDHLSIVSEETLTGSCTNPSSPNLPESNADTLKDESEYKPDGCSALIDFQSIVPSLAYFENLCYEDIGPNLDASGEIHYSGEPINPKITKTDIQPNKKTSSTNGWNFDENFDSEQFDRKGPDFFVQNGIPMLQEPIYAEINKKPTSNFQVGGNLDELLQNIEHLSQDIIQMQHENQKISSKYNMTSNMSEKAVTPMNDSNSIHQVKPYRSEMNLMLCFDGTNPKIIPIESEVMEVSTIPIEQDSPPPSLPKPMTLLPTTLTYIASDNAASANDTKCFAETKDCNYLESIRRKIFPKKANVLKQGDKLTNGKVKMESNNVRDVGKTSENTVNHNTVNAADSTDTKRKSRRVPLALNSLTKDIAAQNDYATIDQLSQQNKSKRHHRKVRRRHSDGNLRNRNGSNDSMPFGRCSSRESSVSVKSQKAQKIRKSSKGKSSNENVGKIPWFGCWGNECMY